MTTALDSKYMAIVLTQEGFIRWAQGKRIAVLDVKPEYREALWHNFIGEVPRNG